MKKLFRSENLSLKISSLILAIILGTFSFTNLILAEDSIIPMIGNEPEQTQEADQDEQNIYSTPPEDAPSDQHPDYATTTEENSDPLNSDTGADSANNATTTLNTEISITNNNNAFTNNDSLITANTGNNIASHNTGSGIITTNKARGRGELVNLINRNIANAQPQAPSDSSSTNENTGANSDNFSSENYNNRLNITNINSANVQNRIHAEANSGRNKSDANTGHGIILSGDAELGLNLINIANTNLTNIENLFADWQNIYGNYNNTIDISIEASREPSELASAIRTAGNTNTGADSNNVSISQYDNELSIVNNNTGVLNNQIDANAISGQNTSNANTGSGSIATGDVSSAVNVINLLNSNIVASNWWLKVINIFGDFTGDLILPSMPSPNLSALVENTESSLNQNTGADSTNEIETEINSTTTITNTNNASIINNVSVNANAGGNMTSYNGGIGSSHSGESDTETNTVNISNVNVAGDSWWTIAVNHFGPWTGTTFGSPENMEIISDGNATIISPSGSGVEASNSDTGALSNNTADVSINNSTEITNENDGQIINNLNVNAISGENQTEYNTGHGYVYSGNVKAMNNLVNFANANIAAGNWLLGVINIFGSWAGDLIFEDSTSTIDIDVATNSGTNNSSNTNTGAGSDNNSEADTNSTTTITNNNNSTVNNDTGSNATSGGNSASGNTGNGIIATGESDANSSVTNNQNNNQTQAGGSASSTATCQNENTGASSTNSCSSASASENNIINNNNATTTNSGSATSNTGGNNANNNTGNGIVDTSWAQTFVELYNEHNDNQITVGDVVDDLTDDETPDDNGGDNGGDNANGNNPSTPDANNSNAGGVGGGGGSNFSAPASSFDDDETSSTDFYIISKNKGSIISKIFDDGMKIELDIAQGTFNDDVVITFSQLKLTKASNPLTRYNASLAGSKAIKLSIADTNGNEINSYNKSIFVKVTYPQSATMEKAIGTYYFDAISPKWVLIKNAVDPTKKILAFAANRNFIFGAFNVPNTPDMLKITETSASCKIILDYGDRNLLRNNASGKIYILANAKKKYVSTVEELKKYPGIPVYDAREQDLLCYPEIDLAQFGPREYANNVLLRNIDNNRVYQIINGMRKYIPSLAQIKSLKHLKMIQVASDIINNYPLMK